MDSINQMIEKLHSLYPEFTSEEYLQCAIESLANREVYGMHCEYKHLSHTDALIIQKRLKYMLLDKAFADTYLEYLPNAL